MALEIQLAGSGSLRLGTPEILLGEAGRTTEPSFATQEDPNKRVKGAGGKGINFFSGGDSQSESSPDVGIGPEKGCGLGLGARNYQTFVNRACGNIHQVFQSRGICPPE